MAKLKTIKYGRTFNLGNYRSERIDLEIEVGEHEQNQHMSIFSYMKDTVERMHKEGQKV